MYGNKLLARAQAMIKDKMVPEEPIVAASQPVYVRAKTLQAISIAISPAKDAVALITL